MKTAAEIILEARELAARKGWSEAETVVLYLETAERGGNPHVGAALIIARATVARERAEYEARNAAADAAYQARNATMLARIPDIKAAIASAFTRGERRPGETQIEAWATDGISPAEAVKAWRKDILADHGGATGEGWFINDDD